MNYSVIAFASLASHRKLKRQQWDRMWTASNIREKSADYSLIYRTNT